MFVKIIDGVIDGIYSSTKDLTEEGCIEVPEDFIGHVGMLREYWTDTWELKTDNTLVGEGLKPEIRGTWYTSDGDPVQITSVWADVGGLRRTPQELILP